MEQEKLLGLIERSRQGDPAAQEALILETQQRVYYHCKKMLKKEEDAQDATQDVLITMLTSLDKLREPAAFWGWVNGITANRCKHLLSAPHKEWQIPEDEEGNSLLDSLEDLDEQAVPDKALDNEETRRMILGLVDDLPPEQRMSVLFYYYDEMSVKQIAEAMDVSEGTVKSRLNYARKSIKCGVEDYERKGVRLYGVSPLLLLLYFLRQDAEATTLSAASAGAIAETALAAAGASASGAAVSTAAAGSAASGAAAAAAGAAAKAGAGISAKLIAGILAGAIAAGGVGAGITAAVMRDAPASDIALAEPAEEEPEEAPEEDAEIAPPPEDGVGAPAESAPAADGETLPEDVKITVPAGGIGCEGKTRSGPGTVYAVGNETALVDTDGSLWMWGQTEVTGTGGPNGPVPTPRQVMDDAVLAWSFTSNQRAAVRSDSSLWMWGLFRYGPLYTGAPHTGEQTFVSSPTWVMDDVAAVSCGLNSTAVLKTDGSLWSWRDEAFAPPNGDVTALVHVMDGVVGISNNGVTTYAIKEDGSLWSWYAGGDQRIDGEADQSVTHTAPVHVMDNVAAVAAGPSGTAAVGTDGSLWIWGSYTTAVISDTPVKIMDNVVCVSVGQDFLAAVQDDGSLWMMGRNKNGQLGNGTREDSSVMVKVMDDVVDVACGADHTVAIKADGTVWAWGLNASGALGMEILYEVGTNVPRQTEFTLHRDDGAGEPAESGSTPEPAALSAAYAAYLDVLSEHESLIDYYTTWGTCRRCVALVDIMGDSTPELIFVEAASAASSQSYLTILTYRDGQTVTLARLDWDFFAASGLSYKLYQAEGSKELCACSVQGDTYTLKEWIRFADEDGALSPERLQSDSRDGMSYTWNGAAVDEAEFDRRCGDFPSEAEHMLMSSTSSDTLAMTCAEAIAFLQENA